MLVGLLFIFRLLLLLLPLPLPLLLLFVIHHPNKNHIIIIAAKIIIFLLNQEGCEGLVENSKSKGSVCSISNVSEYSEACGTKTFQIKISIAI